MAVSSSDIAFMKNIQNAMNGGVSLNSVPTPSQSHNPNVGFTPDNPSMYLDKMKDFMRIVEGVETPKNNDVKITKTYDDSDYEVVVDLDESGRFYVVKDSNRNVYENKIFSVFESAMAVCKILNGEGEERHIENFIELDEDFKKEKQKALESKKDYNRSIEIKESRMASVFENKFKRYQENANSIYKDIKSLFSMI